MEDQKIKATSCLFEFGKEYVVVDSKKTTSHDDYGFSIRENDDHQPYAFKIKGDTSSSSTRYELPIVTRGVLTVATIKNKFEVVGKMDKTGKKVAIKKVAN